MYPENNLKLWSFIVISLLMGMCIMLVPLPDSLDIVRPDIFTFILLFWLTQESAKMGIWSVFFIIH